MLSASTPNVVVENFEIQRCKPQNFEWEHYHWYNTWEIGEESINWLRKNKINWKYRLVRTRTIIETKILNDDDGIL